MPDPSETGVNLGAIFKLLEQADQSAQVDNPYAGLTKDINSIQWNPAEADPNSTNGDLRYSLKDNIVGGLIKGLAGGVSKSFQDNYQTNQDNKAADFLKLAMSGGDTSVRPEGMAPSIFSNVKNAASIFDMEKAAQLQNHAEKIADRKSELADELQSKIDFATNPDVLAAEVKKNTELAANKPDKPIPALGVEKLATGTTLIKEFDKLQDMASKMSVSPVGDSAVGGLLRGIKSYSSDTPEGQYQAQLLRVEEMANKQISNSTRYPVVKANLENTKAGRFGSLEGLQQIIANTRDLVATDLKDHAETYGDAGYKKLNELADKKGVSLDGQTKTATPPNVPDGAIPTGKTSGGKPVYSVDGKLWVAD